MGFMTSTSQRYAEKGVSREIVTGAFFAGCFVMALSLVIEKYATASSGGSTSGATTV